MEKPSDPEDRLIRRTSILRCPPNELDEEQARLLTGIRLNAQALEGAWIRLWGAISRITQGDSEPDDTTLAVISAWQVVDSFHLVRRFADQFLQRTSLNLGPYQDEFQLLRNDHQHRLERAVTRENSGGPHLGALHWVYVRDDRFATGYTAWIGARQGRTVSEVNPLRRMTSDRPGIQGVELESFSGTARLQEGVTAMVRFVRGLEEDLEAQLGHLGRGQGDVVVVAEFEYGIPDDDYSQNTEPTEP